MNGLPLFSPIDTIRADGVTYDSSVGGTFNTPWQFLPLLPHLGSEVAGKWLEEKIESTDQCSRMITSATFL